MSLNSSMGSVDLNGSALRTGLLDIKPFEISRTIKKFGVKLTEVIRGFETLKPARSFSEVVSQSNQAIFSMIEIPPRFEANKLAELYSRNIIKAYDQDIELKEIVKKIETKTTATPLSDLVRFVMSRLSSDSERSLEIEAASFLNSNFPLSFYNRFIVFDNVYCDFLKILEKTVGYYEVTSSVAGDPRRRNMYISEMKKKIGPMIDQMDTTFFEYLSLRRYIKIWNSETYEDLERQTFFDSKRTNSAKLNQLVDNLELKLSETRKQILQSPYWTPQKVDFNMEPAGRMFSEILMMS